MAAEVLSGFVELAIAHDCRRPRQPAEIHECLNRIDLSLRQRWTENGRGD